MVADSDEEYFPARKRQKKKTNGRTYSSSARLMGEYCIHKAVSLSRYTLQHKSI